MRTGRRWALVFLGIFGSGLCLGAIVATWIGRGRVDQSSAQVLESAQTSVGHIGGVVQRANRAVAAVRAHFKTTLTDAQADALAQRAGDISTRVASARSTAEAARSVIEAIADLPLALPSTPGDGIAKRLSQLPEFLGEVEHALRTARDRLRERVRGDEGARETHFILTKIGMRLEAADELVSHVQRDLTRVREHLPVWLTTAAVLLTLFFVWMGVGQRCLATRGRAAGTVA